MNKNIFSCCLLFISITIFSKPSDFNFRREITPAANKWQKIILPDEMYSRLNTEFSDIRIFGFKGNDTIEAPYIIDFDKDVSSEKRIEFSVINKSYNSNGYYFTFDAGETKTINKIQLNFSLDNFDWRVDLEGSMDLNEWFLISKDSRIVSMKNEYADYVFTTLRFDYSSYRYFRLLIKSNEETKFQNAIISEEKVNSGNYRIIKTSADYSEKKRNNTEINIILKHAVPVSFLKLNFSDKIDFYRSVVIEYLFDSIKTEKGTRPYFQHLLSGYVSSLSSNQFSFDDILTKHIRIIIRNQDNQPLNFASSEVKGKIYSLKARFDEDADYFIYYGSKYSSAPNYDIVNFKDKIPGNINEAKLSEEEILIAGISQKESNKIWLWVVISLLIVTIGAFTLKMLKNENKNYQN